MALLGCVVVGMTTVGMFPGSETAIFVLRWGGAMGGVSSRSIGFPVNEIGTDFCAGSDSIPLLSGCETGTGSVLERGTGTELLLAASEVVSMATSDGREVGGAMGGVSGSATSTLQTEAEC